MSQDIGNKYVDHVSGMSKARLVITAVLIDGRKPAEVAPAYAVTLLARDHAEGEAAFEPRSRRPHTATSALAPAAAELIRRLRKELAEQHLDAGADTIDWPPAPPPRRHRVPAIIHRYLRDAGLITPEPKKRPKSSYIRCGPSCPTSAAVRLHTAR
jgi:hypothetical protein